MSLERSDGISPNLIISKLLDIITTMDYELSSTADTGYQLLYVPLSTMLKPIAND